MSEQNAVVAIYASHVELRKHYMCILLKAIQ